MGFRVHPAWWFFGGSGLVLAGLAVALFAPGLFTAQSALPPLVVHCAAGLRGPMEGIAKEYERERGQRVEVQYKGSQDILSSIKTTRIGDVFLPADESYIDDARKDNLIAPEVIPLARMTAVVAVAAGNPKHIESWSDLFRADVGLAQAEPKIAAIGRLTRDHMIKTGQWENIDKKTKVYKETVNHVANAVALGSVDAGIVWDVVAWPDPKLAMVALPGLDAIKARVQVAVLTTSKQPTAALQFARYVAGRDKGLKRFRDCGFVNVETGDAGALKPELVFYAGAMLKPAIEKTITEFEQREGVSVTRVYNGCGILVSQMKAGERPDLFFACDTRFMDQAREWFADPGVVSSNQLVIAVKKGNPHGVKSLADLAKPGLKVGVGHEHQCALGAITRDTFIQTGTYAAVAKNIVVQSPTGDLLVNQLRPGALDAAVVYRSNVLPYEKDLDFTPVTGVPCAAPEQPIAVGKHTEYPRLTARLIEAIRSAESRQRFEDAGFGWGKK
jgi:molybdenum ABC transporter molybdate-binding protein